LFRLIFAAAQGFDIQQLLRPGERPGRLNPARLRPKPLESPDPLLLFQYGLP